MPFEGRRHCCCREGGLEALALLGHSGRSSVPHKHPGSTEFISPVSLLCNFKALPHMQSSERVSTYLSITAVETNLRTPG